MNLLNCCFPKRKVESIEKKTLYKKSDDLEKICEQLQEIESEKIPYFSFKGQTFYAKPCNIYDGDTFSVIFFYKGDFIKYRCRMMGYDSAEMKPSLSNPNRDHEKVLALNAKYRLSELLIKHPSKLIKIECHEFEKYGRLLVNVWNQVDEKSINDIMVEEKHGKPYAGGKKETWA